MVQSRPSSGSGAPRFLTLRPRPTTIHKAPCKHCPSAHFPPDPESQDIKEHYPRKDQIESVFPCAWRPEAICKGVCDYLGVTEQDIATAWGTPPEGSR